MSRIKDTAAFHELYDEFGSDTHDAQFRDPVAINMAPVCTLDFFSRATQDRSSDADNIRRLHRFYSAGQMETGFSVLEVLVA